MSRINFQNAQEKEIVEAMIDDLVADYAHPAAKAALAELERLSLTPIPDRFEDPRIRALHHLLREAARWLEAKTDSDMAKHKLQLLGMAALLLSEQIEGNTKFHKRAA